jgi:drug/metabolite transporter (DMT)-like permease
MTTVNLLLTLVCVIGIAIGQILFKQAARSLIPGDGLIAMATNAWLLFAFLLYGGATLLWVYILRTTPLALAYSLFALAFVIVPILSAVFLGEPLRLSYFIGGALIVSGVFISTQGKW